jgi:PAS domain S-box-containing protein
MCDFLDDLGFSVLQAPNGRLGMEIVRKEKPDLVLTDLRMPEMNGLDVLAELQSNFPTIPVIVISGTGSLQDVVQSMKLGAWDYILKPVHDNSIIELSINRVLDRKRLIDENTNYRVHLEEEVVKRSDELLKSTLRCKTLFTLAGDTIFIFDIKGRILEANRQASVDIGYTQEELSHISIFELIDSSSTEIFNQNLEKLTSGSTTMYETTFRHRNGTIVPMEINACSITAQESQQFLGVCRNISERKKAEEQRRVLEQQVVTAQKMELIGLLASGVAHDFNNVLSALKGYASLLQMKMKSEGLGSDYLTKINDIIGMGQKLTGRITSFIRKDKEELVNVDIHKVLKDTESLLKPNCYGVDIQLQLSAENPVVLGDETQLQNAFLNLGINARDAMPDGGTIKFTTFMYTSDDVNPEMQSLCITILDTGTGMSPETLSRIFDPLFTTKENGKGTGLGLTSVLYCIKNLHGKIDVKSTPGKGTVFTLDLPVVETSIQRDQ